MIRKGIVEDNKDPDNSARVRVRVFGVHSASKSETPTESLPWAEVMGSNAFGLIGGVGVSSVLQVGTWVYVVFIDPDYQRPIVMGTVIGINDGGIPDLFKNVDDNLQTIQTKSGHLIKIDDNSGSEEVSITHKTGTTINMSADGSMLIQTANNLLVSSEGLADFSSKGDMRLYSEGNIMIQGATTHIQPGMGFAMPALSEPPYPYKFETIDFEPPPNYNVDEPDAPVNPENEEEVEEAPVSELAEGEQRNVYDVAYENLQMGESAWTEKGSSSRASSNPNIMALWDEIGIPNNGDITAWCAVYLSATLKRSGNVGLVTASARAYLKYPGVEIDLKDIKKGDICVFWRGKKNNSVFGHVGIFTGVKTATRLQLIGGNQGSPGRLKRSNFGINANNPSASYGLLKIFRPVNEKGEVQPDAKYP